MTIAELEPYSPGPWVVRVAFFVFGLLWGSFLNVVIYRAPRGMSVVRPASHCPGCGKPVRAYDNIPILSFLILRGKARCCGAKLSPRYLFVELLGGGLSLAILEVVLAPLAPETELLRASAMYAVDFALAMGLLAATFIDLEHMYLPDVITIGGAVLGIASFPLRDTSLLDAVIGAAVGFAGVWLPFNVLYKKLRGKVGMGLGDAKLTMLAGAWFGWQGAIFALFAGALQGSLVALAVYIVRGRIDEPPAVTADREELERAAAEGDEEAQKALDDDPLGAAPDDGLMGARLPFGPFLILAIFEYLFFGEWLRETYFTWVRGG